MQFILTDGVLAIKTYETLLMDLDDTLLDFRANEHDALEILFGTMKEPLDREKRELYDKINRRMWREYEEGKLAREELLNTRFRILFEHLGRRVDGAEAEAIYREALGRGAQLIEGALEVCQKLGEKYALHIVTNGTGETQMKRLEASGLRKKVGKVFVSELIGHSKPSRAFFDRVFSELRGTLPERALIVGDSLTSDVQGGINAGIDTCWFNPSGQTGNGKISATYEVRSLYELIPLLM